MISGKWLMAIAVYTASMNGCTMGVDQAMMNNVNIMHTYLEYFSLETSPSIEGLFVASVNIGSVAGGFFAAPLIDHPWVGRKGGILASALITMVGVALQTAAQNRAMFVIGRIIIGIAVTVNAVAAPTYVSEISKPKDRGLLVGLYMTSWYVAAIIITAISLGTYNLDSTWAFRSISLFQLLPSLLALPVLPFIKESPRFLMYNGREEEALDVLADYHGDGDREAILVLQEYEEIKQVIQFEKENKIGWISLFTTKPNLWRISIVFFMGMFSQLSGSNIVSSYLGIFLTNAGITSERTQIIMNLIMNIVDLFAAFAGSFLTEGLGRKQILFWSTCVMAVCLFLMGGLTKEFADGGNSNGTNALLFFTYLFSATYSFSFTPLCVTYPVELLNYSVRAKGMAVSQIVTFGFGFFNQYVLPIAIDAIGYKYYIINAAYNIVQAAIIVFLFVEIKGLSLEEIDEKFENAVHYSPELSKIVEIDATTHDPEDSLRKEL